MAKQSAGILVYRKTKKGLEVFLGHPGGPFYAKKDVGVWSLPKGEFDEDEEPLIAAKREFEEETGEKIDGNFITLRPVKYKSGKIVHAWAVEGDIDPTDLKSNFFKLEWPPKSGKFIDVPEIDRCEWFTLEKAKEKILPALLPLLNELIDKMQ
jgi:predicted NUDIX family NTP pyrophosphohydrolase